MLNSLAARHKDLRTDIKAVLDRLVDLLPPLQAHYYHPKMMGSWSIKAVLPAVWPALSYEALGQVKDGGAAQEAYAETLQPDCTVERRAELQRALLAYCKLDTDAMLGVVRTLSA